MRKVTYSIKMGLVGPLNSKKEIMTKFLEGISLEVNTQYDYTEYLILHNLIPIKLKIYNSQDLNGLIYNYDKIESLDVLILTCNIFNPKSLDLYYKGTYQEFVDYYFFKGVSLLVGINPNNTESEQDRLKRDDLITKARELNLMYLFEIETKTSDVNELKDKILDDFIFKFQYSSPELLEAAKDYGLQLLNEKEVKQADIELESESEQAELDLNPLKIIGIEQTVNRIDKRIFRDPGNNLIEHTNKEKQDLISHIEPEKHELISLSETEKLVLIEDKEQKLLVKQKEIIVESTQVLNRNESRETSKIDRSKGVKEDKNIDSTVLKEQTEEKEKIETMVKKEKKEEILTIEKPEGRRKCPKCNCEDQRMIHESLDRDYIICDYPRIYGKKFRCGECGTIWREQ